MIGSSALACGDLGFLRVARLFSLGPSGPTQRMWGIVLDYGLIFFMDEAECNDGRQVMLENMVPISNAMNDCWR